MKAEEGGGDLEGLRGAAHLPTVPAVRRWRQGTHKSESELQREGGLGSTPLSLNRGFIIYELCDFK